MVLKIVLMKSENEKESDTEQQLQAARRLILFYTILSLFRYFILFECR